MDPILGGLITGGASLLGNIFTANTNAANTQAQIAAQEQMLGQTQNFNAAQAANAQVDTQANMGLAERFNDQERQAQQQFQTSMSNTAYQRAVSDMKAAGLNPAMMFTHGAAESTPSGSAPSVGAPSGPQASISTPTAPMPTRTAAMGQLGDVVSKAISSAGALQGMERQSSEIEKAKWDAKKSYYDQYVRSMDLPAAERKAAEDNWINQHTDDVRTHALSTYRGDMFGTAGGAANSVARGANTVADVVSNKVVPWFKDRINDVTGPTGQALWDKARGAVGRGGTVLDLKDFPNIRRTTLNPDYGEKYD